MLETRLSSGAPGCRDTKTNITSSSSSSQTTPGRGHMAAGPGVRRSSCEAGNVPSWKGHTVSQSALHRRPQGSRWDYTHPCYTRRNELGVLVSVLCKTGSGLQASFCSRRCFGEKYNIAQKRLITTVLVSRPCGRADPLPSPKSPNPAPLTHSQPSSNQPGAATTPVRHPPAQWRPGHCGPRGGEGRRRGGPGRPHLAGGATRDVRLRLPLGMAAGSGGKRRKLRAAEGTGGSSERHGLVGHPHAASEGHRGLRHFRHGRRGAGLSGGHAPRLRSRAGEAAMAAVAVNK